MDSSMSSSATLQKQIASIMDELSKAALMEISKVVDDGVVMLKLEICEREHEIDSLKRNLQMVSEELRQTRRALVRQCVSTGRSTQLLKGAKDKGKSGSETETRIEDSSRASNENSATPSGVVVKLESADEEHPVKNKIQCKRTEPDLLPSSADTDQSAQVWTSENSESHDPRFYTGHNQSQHIPDHPTTSEQDVQGLSEEDELSADSLHAAQDEMLRVQNNAGLPQSHSYTHNTLLHPPPDCPGDFGALSLGVVSRGRPMTGLEKRRYACAFCVKSFDRLSHLERHQRIHTGEKPFSCMLCGRCFTQKSSLKSHLKTHRGFTADLEGASLLPSEGGLFSDEWNMASHGEDQIPHNFDRNAEELNSQSSYLDQESSHFINAEGESIQGSHVDQEIRNPQTRLSDFPAEKNNRPADVHDTEEEVEKDQPLEDGDELRHLDSGSDSVMDDGETGTHSLNAGGFCKDSAESDCPEITDHVSQMPAQNQHRFESTSTVLHSWGSVASSEPESEGVSQIHVKKEEEDVSPSNKEHPNHETSYTLPPDPNSISPIDQSSIVDSLRTMETSDAPDLSYDGQTGRQRVLNGRERRFLCVLCGKSFDRLSHLDRHQRIHTGEKPYSCGTCGRRFTQKSSLKGHMRTHTGERGFSCALCGMSFPTRASQYRHQCN